MSEDNIQKPTLDVERVERNDSQSECFYVGQTRGSSSDSVVCRICQASSDELRYGCCESVLVWYRNPDNRNLLMIIAYSANVIIIARDHVLPWYRWWKSARNVRLSRIEIIDHQTEPV
uniref:Uncharacterized protein n=1 Tax=Anopheles atroparvus TaxID=41427 RepID=A0A182JIA6_ANOAO